MPITDKDVGITEILGSHRPFRAVLKQCVDDFVVNEVLLSGKVAQLTRLAELPRRSPRTDDQKQLDPDNTKNQADDVKPEQKPNGSPSELPFDKLEACFPEEVQKSMSESVQIAIETGATELILPVCDDKQKRKDIHEWVRNHMSAYVTDTVEQEVGGGKGQAVRLRKRDSCRPWKRRRITRDKRDRGDRDRADAANNDTFDPREQKSMRHKQREPDDGSHQHVGRDTYVTFVLWKRNKDTMEALNVLSKILRIPAGAFAYAGTKDKRAVTTQLIQVRGVSEGRLASANKVMARRDRGFRFMAVGNVEILPQGLPRALGLGDLLGNRFTLALRDMDVQTAADEKNIESAVDSLRTHGFVNYFGLQRFGSGVSGTHETGFAFLRGDFEDVCRRILLPLRMDEWEGQGNDGIRPERRNLICALERFGKKEISAKELLQELPKWMHIERALAESFAHDEEQGFNKYDYRAAFGKLPRNLRRMYGHAVQSYLWNIMASERIRMDSPDRPSRMHAVKGDLVLVDPDLGKDLNYETPVRVVTEIEEQEKSVSIFRVLIPVVGSEVPVREDMEYGKAAKKILEAQKIDLESRLSADYGMKGTYRPLLARPRDVEMKIVSYSNNTDVLIPSSVIQFVKREGGVIQSEKTEKEQDSSDSRKMANSSTNRDVDDTHQDEGSCTPGKLVSDANAKASEEVQKDAANPEDKNVGVNPDGAKKALVISFTLGRGEFATMLVRELTGMDSSTANQKAMQDASRKA